MRPQSLLPLLLVLFKSPLGMSQSCPYGPDTCIEGLVWREAFEGDHVCVTPDSRDQAAEDNAAAESRKVSPDSDECQSPFVPRKARENDNVCVTTTTRDITALENGGAQIGTRCDCTPRFQNCAQHWFGAGPFCGGNCPDGWDKVREGGDFQGITCDDSSPGRCVTSCTSDEPLGCTTGAQWLCEQCTVTIVQAD